MLAFFFNGVEEVVERYLVVIPFYDEFHNLAYSDMVSQMILDRLGKGDADVEELVKELGLEDMEVHLDKLVEKALAINNGDGTYSLNSGGLLS